MLTIVVLSLLLKPQRASSSTHSIVNNANVYVVELTSICLNDGQRLNHRAIRFHLRLLDSIAKHSIQESRVGYKTYDICYDSKLTLEAISDIILNDMYRKGRRGSRCSTKTCIKDTTNILAIISFIPIHSQHLTKLISEVLSVLDVPYFAFTGKTSPSQINLRANYYTIYQVLLKDIDIFEEQILEYGIKHVALVILGENRFATFHRDKVFETLVKHGDICIDVKDIRDGDYARTKQYLTKLRNDKTIKMILVWNMKKNEEFARQPGQKPLNFVEFTYHVYDKIWYWYPFLSSLDFIGDPRSVEVNFNVFNPLHLRGEINTLSYENLKERVQESIYKEIIEDKYIERYLKDLGKNKNGEKIFKHFDSNETSTDVEIETLLHLFRLQLPCMLGARERCNEVFLVNFLKGGGGRLPNESFDFSVTHDLLNAIRNEKVKMCKRLKCEAGFEPYKSIYDVSNDEKKFGWRCKRCSPKLVKSSYSNASCTTCKGDRVANSNKTACYDPYQMVYLGYHDKGPILILLITMPSFIFNLIAIATCLKYSETPVIRSSGSYRSVIQLISHTAISVSILVLFIVKLNFYICILQVVATGYLLTIIMSFKITKIQTLLFAFHSKVPMNPAHVRLAKGVEIAIIVTLVVVNSIITFISFYEESELLELSLDRQKLTRTYSCLTKHHFDYQMVFILTLSLFCAIQAFRSRNLPRYFAETTKLTCSIYITIVVVVVRFPLIYQQPTTNHNLINAIIITIINSSQLFIDFSLTVFIVLFHPEKNTRQYFRELIMRHSYKRTDIEMEEISDLMDKRKSVVETPLNSRTPDMSSSGRDTLSVYDIQKRSASLPTTRPVVSFRRNTHDVLYTTD